jgi:hypothetical protein
MQGPSPPLAPVAQGIVRHKFHLETPSATDFSSKIHDQTLRPILRKRGESSRRWYPAHGEAGDVPLDSAR